MALPVESIDGPSVARGLLVDRSGSITTNATSQKVMDENRDRRYLFLLNISNTDLWVEFGGDAVQDKPSLILVAAGADGKPGGSFVMEGSFVCVSAVYIIGPTAGKKFVAKENLPWV